VIAEVQDLVLVWIEIAAEALSDNGEGIGRSRDVDRYRAIFV
jgi:hypothetical protein